MPNNQSSILAQANLFFSRHYPDSELSLNNGPSHCILRAFNSSGREDLSMTISHNSGYIIGVSGPNDNESEIRNLFDMNNYKHSFQTIDLFLNSLNQHNIFKQTFQSLEKFNSDCVLYNNSFNKTTEFVLYDFFIINSFIDGFKANCRIYISFKFNKQNDIVCIPFITIFSKKEQEFKVAFNLKNKKAYLVKNETLFEEDFWAANKIVDVDKDFNYNIESVIDELIISTHGSKCSDFDDMSIEQKIELLQMICI
jgi:hypothetical protein